MIVIVPFTILLILFITTEFTTYQVYGSFVKDEDALKYIDEFEIFSKNPYNNEILSPSTDGLKTSDFFRIITDGRYISLTKLSVLSRYHIKDMGRIPIWSKTHKVIKELYKNSKTNDFRFS
jgi:hypothetical protein